MSRKQQQQEFINSHEYLAGEIDSLGRMLIKKGWIETGNDLFKVAERHRVRAFKSSLNFIPRIAKHVK